MEPAADKVKRPGTVEVRIMAVYPTFDPVGTLEFNTVQQQETFLRVLELGAEAAGVQCHASDVVGTDDVAVMITTR